MSIRVYRRVMIMLLIFVLSVSGGYFLLKYQENKFALAVQSSDISTEKYVIPGGMPVGIYLETEGVLVLGTEEIVSKDGVSNAPAKNLVKSGDYIVGINNNEISDKKELVEAVDQLNSEHVILHLKREEKYIDITLTPTQNIEGDYKLGIWVRDNAHGLGTLTYIDENYSFGALGHGIHDVDTNDLLEISEGTLYVTNIRNIRKGKTGTPGGLEGVIVYNNYNILGEITDNSDVGVFGKIDRLDKIIPNTNPVPVGKIEDTTLGPAYILCSVNGQVEQYEIEIIGLFPDAKEINKRMKIKVTDKTLLEETGGIVQGMGVRYNRDNTGNP